MQPLGLVMCGSVSYLVATAWDYDEARLYALLRFRKVEILDDAVKAPKGFSLDKAIASGLAEFANQGAPIRLEIRCADWVKAHLAETPLATDQKTKPKADGWVRLTATVNDTWQLRWWLMGQGAGVEVCAPVGLREEVKKALHDAAKLYSKILGTH